MYSNKVFLIHSNLSWPTLFLQSKFMQITIIYAIYLLNLFSKKCVEFLHELKYVLHYYFFHVICKNDFKVNSERDNFKYMVMS